MSSGPEWFGKSLMAQISSSEGAMRDFGCVVRDVALATLEWSPQSVYLIRLSFMRMRGSFEANSCKNA